MLQVGAQETDLKTESHVQMVYLGVLSGLCLEGSQKSTTGQEERLNYNAVATEASANSMSSEAGTDSSRCCRLRRGDQAWFCTIIIIIVIIIIVYLVHQILRTIY